MGRERIDERRLRESEARARAVVEQAADPLFVHDLEGWLVDVNERATESLGYTRDELLSMHLTDIDVDLDLTLARADWEALTPKDRRTVRGRQRKKDGTIFPVEVRLGVFDLDGARYVLGLARDLSEAQRVEEEKRLAADALRASEERYRQLVDNLDSVVFCTDLEGRITYMNQAIKHFGYRPEETVGRHRDEFVHPSDRESALLARTRQLDEGSSVAKTIEYRLIDAQGKVHPVRSTARPLRAGDKIVGSTGIIADVTAQREAEEQLRAAQKMEAVGRLAGGVAHDFNNLLCVILSYAELAVADLRPEDPLHADLTEIVKAAHRAEVLTRQLLAFSRKQHLDPVALDLGALVAGVGNMLRRLIGEDVELSLVTAPELHEVKVDRGQIEQVVMNLVVNARDAMPEGGRVTITTSNAALDGARAAALELPPGAYVELSVADTGTGMSPETIARAFEPFFTTKPVGKGTGLGLSTVYGIIKQSGGGITIDSAPGRGTTFRAYLPRHERLDALGRTPTSAATAPTHAQRGHETILVVEDEPALRALAKRVLSAAGYHVFVTANAGEALLVCEREGERLDLVLTDLVMPGTSGRQLVERIRPLVPRAKVLFMSGYEEALAEIGGGAEVIAKPFDGRGLVARVKGVLEERGAGNGERGAGSGERELGLGS